MNQLSPDAAAPETSSQTDGGGIVTSTPSYEERVAATFGDDADGPDGTAPAPLDEAASRRVERRKQLDVALAEETQRVDAQQRRRSADEATQRATSAERERDELRQQLDGRVDPSSLDEAGFFSLAKKLNIPAKKLADWLQTQAQNPEYIASQAAQREIDPKLAALHQQIEVQRRELAEFKSSQESSASQAVAMQRGDAMIGFAAAQAASAPHAARFLESYGEERFIAMALSAMPDKSFRPGWEQHTLDSIENHLSDFAKIYSTPQQRQAPPPPKNGAAKPMTTVSNTLAQSRASVVPDGVDFSSLSYEERVKRAFE